MQKSSGKYLHIMCEENQMPLINILPALSSVFYLRTLKITQFGEVRQ